ncbi:MAP kinase phosphatase with leucine-rich repeats protein 1 [Zancudomyces culisetae]|uniref:protein-tyrosine-phosphatase n=1 Tax=Zancudomyces culisetae TaxID=1213189 RepID=A0A1R1PNM1_ZANCU|nr:MAP kinase phosphatase with leucine-rich repeats protein 1 [Zancudomyces culisetae]|eukprot:OMH82554.1 MAP kinase phosphatase with leucine-rich repeats protein 1 [Zancudomyces culisetae]
MSCLKLDGIYIGTINHEADRTWLLEHNIKRIISVINGFTPSFPTEFEYLVLNVDDLPTSDILQYFEPASLFINQQTPTPTQNENENGNGNVLIHCVAGTSRSVTIALAHYMRTHNCSPQAAYSCLLKSNNLEPNTTTTTTTDISVSLPVSVSMPMPNDGLRCKSCRKLILSYPNPKIPNLSIHPPHPKPSSSCTSIILDQPPSWLPLSSETSGKLLCPHCSFKLGQFSWAGSDGFPNSDSKTPLLYSSPDESAPAHYPPTHPSPPTTHCDPPALHSSPVQSPVNYAPSPSPNPTVGLAAPLLTDVASPLLGRRFRYCTHIV